MTDPHRPGRLLLVGCGKMGGALLDGWLAQGIAAADIVVVEPNGVAPSGNPGLIWVNEYAAIPAGFAPDIVVLAVKPQLMNQVAAPYRSFAARACYLSIAAGKTLAGFAGLFGDAAIVRAMPNTPAAVGRGITVLCANGRVSAAQRAVCGTLMAAVGEVAWVEDESLMDAVTAVSGSGPAYVFWLIETLARAGEAAGLSAAMAQQLARATVAGSGELARLSSDSPAQLRQNVTSPNGTTEAALKVLMAPDGLEPLMRRAVEAATRRSRELAG